MTREDVFRELSGIFQTEFDDENIQISETTTSDDIAGWDSIAQISLLVAIEKTFNVKFTFLEASNLKNVGEMVEVILRKIS